MKRFRVWSALAAGIALFAWWRVEPVGTDVHIGGSALLGRFRTLGPVAYVAWLGAAVGWTVAPVAARRALVGLAMAVTVAVPVASPFTSVDRPPLWVLMALFAFGLAGARNSALEQKTKVLIRKLNEALLARMRNYETRRIAWREGQGPRPGAPAQESAGQRLKAIRELMRMELPDKWKDVQGEPVSGIIRPAASKAYQRRLRESRGKDGKPSTEFMKFGDTIRIEMKGKDGQSIFGAIEQKIAPLARS